MILVSATWMGLYLAKRITRPVQLLAAAAREIGAGHFEHRVERETVDEFGSLVDSFNTMADELAASRRALEQSSADLERKHAEVEDRRRFTEAVLDRVATGVITIDAGGRIGILNPAAARLLGLDAGAAGRPAEDVFGSGELKPLAELATRAVRRGQGLAGAGDRAHPRRARGAARACRHAPARRRPPARGPRAGGRRHHAAHPGPEGRGVARGRAAARPRNQEPPDADPAVRPAPAAPVRRARRRRCASWSTSAPARSSARWRRSRRWSTSSRSSRACRRPGACRPTCIG